MKNTNNSLLIIILLIFLGYLNGCNKEPIGGNFLDVKINNDTLTENLYSLTDSNDWSAQLNKIINDPPSLMINSNITLLNYKELGKVENSNDEVMYREMLKSNENMFPIYSKDLLAIRAVHKNEAVNLDSEHQKFTNKKGNYFLDNLTLRGGKILVLKWNNNGF
jgi:hypothetical protein